MAVLAAGFSAVSLVAALIGLDAVFQIDARDQTSPDLGYW